MASPFSLQEFGHLVALALDPGRFSESFLELTSDPGVPELATATIIAPTPEQDPPLFPPSSSFSSPMDSSTSPSARREDRGKPVVATRLFLDKIKRHVLRAAPTATPDFTYSTHCISAPTVLAPCPPTPTPTPTHAPQPQPQPSPDPNPTPTPHPYAHPTLLSGFFDFNDDDDDDEEEEFVPYIPLASQYERNRLEHERRVREKRLSAQLELEEQHTRRMREPPSRRSVFSRPVSSLTDPPPSPSRSVSTSASSHAPLTPTASLFPYPPYPAYSHSDTSSDVDSFSFVSFPHPPSRSSLSTSAASSFRSSAHSSGASDTRSAYTSSSNSHSNSASSRPTSATSTSESHSSASHYVQFADHPFARTQEDPFAKASVQVVVRSPARPASTNAELKPKARRTSTSTSRVGPHNPPPARPLPPPPLTASEDANTGTGGDADPVLPEEWTLWLGASSLPSLAAPTTTTTTSLSPPAPSSPSKRRPSPPSAYHSPHPRPKRKPTPLHLRTAKDTKTDTNTGEREHEDWTLSLPFVRPPAAAPPSSWYAPEPGPPSPPARYQRARGRVRVGSGAGSAGASAGLAACAAGAGAGTMNSSSAGGGLGALSVYAARSARATAPASVRSGVESVRGGGVKPPRTADSAVSSGSTSSSAATVVPGVTQRLRMRMEARMGVGVGVEVVGGQVGGMEVEEDEMDAESMASGTYYSARSSFALTV